MPLSLLDRIQKEGGYIVIVEYSPDDIKQYYFSNIEEAKEVNNHAKSNGLISEIVDRMGNILMFEDC